jgi:hypothetical protein
MIAWNLLTASELSTFSLSSTTSDTLGNAGTTGEANNLAWQSNIAVAGSPPTATMTTFTSATQGDSGFGGTNSFSNVNTLSMGTSGITTGFSSRDSTMNIETSTTQTVSTTGLISTSSGFNYSFPTSTTASTSTVTTGTTTSNSTSYLTTTEVDSSYTNITFINNVETYATTGIPSTSSSVISSLSTSQFTTTTTSTTGNPIDPYAYATVYLPQQGEILWFNPGAHPFTGFLTGLSSTDGAITISAGTSSTYSGSETGSGTVVLSYSEVTTTASFTSQSVTQTTDNFSLQILGGTDGGPFTTTATSGQDQESDVSSSSSDVTLSSYSQTSSSFSYPQATSTSTILETITEAGFLQLTALPFYGFAGTYPIINTLISSTGTTLQGTTNYPSFSGALTFAPMVGPAFGGAFDFGPALPAGLAQYPFTGYRITPNGPLLQSIDYGGVPFPTDFFYSIAPGQLVPMRSQGPTSWEDPNAISYTATFPSSNLSQVSVTSASTSSYVSSGSTLTSTVTGTTNVTYGAGGGVASDVYTAVGGELQNPEFFGTGLYPDMTGGNTLYFAPGAYSRLGGTLIVSDSYTEVLGGPDVIFTAAFASADPGGGPALEVRSFYNQ